MVYPERTRGSSKVGKLDGAMEFMKYGRYEILKEIGKGSMGVVYQARDPHIDRLVALKVLRPDRVSSEEFMKRFMKEAKAIGRLSHPNIVAVYDIGEDRGTAYIAEEYLEGLPLDLTMEKGRLSTQDIVAIGISVAETLDYAHRKGIVHRDVKPSNIIVLPDKHIKLTDFSIAHIEDSESTVQTQAGEILGTPAYMSPEQVLGQAVDGRTDIFSLGVVLYELATGERPFKGSSLTAIFRAITTASPAQFSKLKSPVPHRVERVIMKSLAKDPGKRYSNGLQMAEALRSCCGEIADEQQTVITTTRSKGTSKSLPAANGKDWRRPAPVLLALAMIVAIGLGGAAYEFFQGEKPPVTVSVPVKPAPLQSLHNRTVSPPKQSAPPPARSPGTEPATSPPPLLKAPVKSLPNKLTIEPSAPTTVPESIKNPTPPPVRKNVTPPASLPGPEVTHQPPPPAVDREQPPSIVNNPISPPAVRELWDNPASAAVEAEKAKRVGELLVKAEAAYDRGDILTLGGSSAGHYYKDVFAIDGTEIDAYKGMMRVIRKYVEWAGRGPYRGKGNRKHYLSMAKECLDVIPEGLKRGHASEIEAVHREIESLSSRMDSFGTRRGSAIR
ncbi:MAG: protein kinase [Syntrophobacteraceae bacterium]|nr:protein kinase [Syntrophobacteraceae bacterium]